MGLSAPVEAAVDEAMKMVVSVVERLLHEQSTSEIKSSFSKGD